MQVFKTHIPLTNEVENQAHCLQRHDVILMKIGWRTDGILNFAEIVALVAVTDQSGDSDICPVFSEQQ